MDAARSPVESWSVEGALTDMEGEGEGVAVDVGVTAALMSRQALLLHNKIAWVSSVKIKDLN